MICNYLLITTYSVEYTEFPKKERKGEHKSNLKCLFICIKQMNENKVSPGKKSDHFYYLTKRIFSKKNKSHFY